MRLNKFTIAHFLQTLIMAGNYGYKHLDTGLWSS